MKNKFSRLVAFVKSIYRAWLVLAHWIGKVNTTILLTLFYLTFLGVAKLATIFARKDLLDECWKDRPNYWRKREGFKVTPDVFLKPY